MLGKPAGETAMGSEFDPYHKWLGIPPEDQPPDYYRLLGIKAFERDPEVIEGAADQRMMVLRTHQTGRHGELSQQLLNEVAAAKVCLLNPEKRAAYDQQLRQKLATKAPPRAVPLSTELAGPVPPTVVRTARRSASRGTRTALIATGVAAAAALIVLLAVWGGGSPPENTAATTPAEPTGGPAVPPPPPGEEPPDLPAEDEPPDTSPASPEPAEPTPEPEPLEPTPEPEPLEIGSSSDAAAGQPVVEPVAAPGVSADGPEEAPPTQVPEGQPAEPVPARSPVPDAAEQAAVFEQLDQIYDLDKDRPDAEKLDLAKELQALGAKDTSTRAERFVLWCKASELARDAGDGALMFEIIDAIGEQYEIDVLMAKGTMLKTLAQRASDTAEIRSVIAASREYADEAVRQNRYDLALAAAKLAHEACIGPEGREFRKAAYDRVRQLEEQHEKHQKLQAALAAVRANPNDPEANLYLGRLYCFEQSDWPRGLPHLARSADPELAHLAAEDLKAPQDAPGRLKLADAWWDLAQTREGEEKDALMLRAGRWYRTVPPEDLSALEKVKVDKRFAEIARLGGSARAADSVGASDGIGYQDLVRQALLFYTFDKVTFTPRGGQVFVQDQSGNDLHGRVFGTLLMPGRLGDALYFGGGDVRVHLGDTPNDAKLPLTVSVWFLPSTLDHVTLLQTDRWDAKKYAGVLLALHMRATRAGFAWGSARGGGGASYRRSAAVALEPEPQQWIHVVGVAKADRSFAVYINGEQKTATVSGRANQMNHTSAPGHIGLGFTGLIDEVGIWDRELTLSEVQILHAGPK